jgi:hypothetical protein
LRTRQDAERALREVLVRVDRATYVEPSTRTVEQYLLTEWLPTQAPPRVSPNRYRNERNAVQRHLVPYLGRLRLQELNANHLDRFYADLLQGGALGADAEPRRPLTPATVVQIHGVIRKALRDAVKWGHLERTSRWSRSALGWSSTAFMLDTYTHLLPGMQAEAAERFARGLFRDSTADGA